MSRTEEVEQEVNVAMQRLEALFTPNVRLTFIMRDPGDDTCHMVLSKDDLSAVAALIRGMVLTTEGKKNAQALLT
jgi:hypothetical protein